MPAKSTLGITPEEGVAVQPCEKLQALDPDSNFLTGRPSTTKHGGLTAHAALNVDEQLLL